MTCLKFFIGILVVSLSLPGSLLAATSDFTVRTYVGNDNTPPTTPIVLTVVPVAPTQINITWSASTDDVMVAGYRLFRDGIQIATTTLLSFSDIGLTPSTTYSYEVDAFDSYGNYSSTSVAMATTTLPNLPPVATSTPTSTNTGGSTRTSPILAELSIITEQTTALFTWKTIGPTQYTLVWGRTQSYELGSVSGVMFNQNHVTTITSLEPGTTYFYELRATDVRGITKVISSDRFTTKSLITSNTLPNVTGFTAVAQNNNDVALSWKNTFTEANYFVRVVRSHLFYPGSIQDGAVVYEGKGETFTDTGALSERSPQYYTVFVLDGTGAVSSGAIARVYAVNSVNPSATVTTTPATSTIPADIGDDTILRAADIIVVQEERMQTFETGLRLITGTSYLISVPFNAVERNLKTIIVSVQNPTNQREVSAYLLKLNQVGDAYIARIPGEPVIGTSRMMVEVFDYELQTVRRISTTVTYVNANLPMPFFPDKLFMYGKYLVPLLLLISFSFWLWLLLYRRRNREDS